MNYIFNGQDEDEEAGNVVQCSIGEYLDFIGGQMQFFIRLTVQLAAVNLHDHFCSVYNFSPSSE